MNPLSLIILMTVTSTQEVDVGFIGFSDNEQFAAWLVEMKRHDRRGFVDGYSLVRLVETNSGRVVETYRGSPIVRQGKKRRTLARRLARNNPKWARASSEKAWATFSREQRFTAEPFAAERQIIRVRPVADAAVTLHPHSVVLRTESGTLGYHVDVGVRSGRRLDIGRFGSPQPSAKPTVARVFVYRSFSGHHFAVMSQIVADGRRSLQTTVLRLRDPLEGGPRSDHPRVSRVEMAMASCEGGAVDYPAVPRAGM